MSHQNDLATVHLKAHTRAIANVILNAVRGVEGPLPPNFGGGCLAFFSPREWEERGETWGRDAELIVCHDGGGMAAFFNSDYGDFRRMRAVNDALREAGYWAEPCTGWYTAIYPRR